MAIVTRIGNIFGLIRMSKSAGMRYVNTISNFIDYQFEFNALQILQIIRKECSYMNNTFVL